MGGVDKGLKNTCMVAQIDSEVKEKLPRPRAAIPQGRLAQDAIRNAYFIICQRPDGTVQQRKRQRVPTCGRRREHDGDISQSVSII
ncbi:hypothetical protein M378DRAFT_157623 [Amanita muscaria Koide BX008]|uniref:Uncharacterized protein n=1 Tax=Amanita muscaria (strain Koide BX008) TaxID=946122 RepID=A0A0C2X515_AMAMK|nr:hypothetical protein M378DRAFT_157623 [Amanita muscaria Koide BX008]